MQTENFDNLNFNHLDIDNLDTRLRDSDLYVGVYDDGHVQLNFDVDFLIFYSSNKERALEMLERVARAYENRLDMPQ